MQVLMPIFYELKKQGVYVDFKTIRSYLPFNQLFRFIFSKNIDHNLTNDLQSYLSSIPGYKESLLPEQQSNKVFEQHGYVIMNLSHILQQLCTLQDQFDVKFNE